MTDGNAGTSGVRGGSTFASDAEGSDELLSLAEIRMLRVFDDPVVLPHPDTNGAGGDTVAHDLIVPRRIALLTESGDEPVDVVTWPETVIWFSAATLTDSRAASGESARLYGYAFKRVLEQADIANADRVLDEVSTVIPEYPSDRFLRRLTKIRRHLRRRQNERFLEEVYPDLRTDVPKSFWETDGAITGYPVDDE